MQTAIRSTLNRVIKNLLLLCVCVVTNVQAALLNPGATIHVVSAAEPSGASLLATTNVIFHTDFFSGSLVSKVWEQDNSNPWGGLTFGYRLKYDENCQESLGWLTLGGFAGLFTDVNYFSSGTTPHHAGRSESGNTIAFSFLSLHGDNHNGNEEKSAWLIIQTDGTDWGVNPLIGINSTTISVATFAPAAVPEPTSLTLLVLAGVVVLTRRSKV